MYCQGANQTYCKASDLKLKQVTKISSETLPFFFLSPTPTFAWEMSGGKFRSLEANACRLRPTCKKKPPNENPGTKTLPEKWIALIFVFQGFFFAGANFEFFLRGDVFLFFLFAGTSFLKSLRGGMGASVFVFGGRQMLLTFLGPESRSTDPPCRYS